MDFLQNHFKFSTLATYIYLFGAIFGAIGLIGKLDLAEYVTQVPRAIIAVFVIASLLMPMAFPWFLRFSFLLGPIIVVGLVTSFLIVFPRVHSLHQIGRGSDQPDCIIVAADNLIKGEWPYQRDKMWTRNPFSCGPGWVALHAPFNALVGYGGTLCIFWMAFLAIFLRLRGWRPATEFVTLLGICPGFWVGAINGTDWLTFGGAVVLIFVLSEAKTVSALSISVLSGIIFQFRLTTLILPLFVKKGRLDVYAYAAFFIGIFCYAAFLVWNYDRFIADGPFHLFAKLFGFNLLSLPQIYFVLSFVIVTVAMLATGALVAVKWGGVGATLLYLVATTTLPAVENLYRHIASSGLVPGLGFWEGGMWILSLVPLAAFSLVSCRNPQTASRSRKI